MANETYVIIPRGCRHYSTMVFAETGEAYDVFDVPEKRARDTDTVWKDIPLGSGTLTVFPPHVPA